MKTKTTIKTERQTEIKGKLYLVTSYYSNDKTLEEVLLQAIKRDVNSYENNKADEKSSHSREGETLFLVILSFQLTNTRV